MNNMFHIHLPSCTSKSRQDSLHGHNDGRDSGLELSPCVEHAHSLQALAQLARLQLIVLAHDPRMLQRLRCGDSLYRVHRQHPARGK